MTTSFNTLSFGVNYVPSQKWWYCWNDFRSDDIARDLDAITQLGADHIRIFLLWPYFQPNWGWISDCHLDRLEKLMELAAERCLDVCPAMLTGWLSGSPFRPVFDRPDAFYIDKEIQGSVDLYFQVCARRLNGHANFLGFDLGNELNCCWKPATLAEGDAWMERMLDLCETLSPQAVHGNGVDHLPWFQPHSFSPEKLAKRQSLIPLHCWIGFTGALRRSGALDRACTHLAPAMATLARAYAGEPDKPIWLQEFGASSEWVEENLIPAFLENAVHAAVAGGICRLTWWCSHDISREFKFPSMEYELGLISTQNKLKPSGFAFQEMARQYGGRPVKIPPALHVPPTPGELLRSPEMTWEWLECVQHLLP